MQTVELLMIQFDSFAHDTYDTYTSIVSHSYNISTAIIVGEGEIQLGRFSTNLVSQKKDLEKIMQ